MTAIASKKNLQSDFINQNYIQYLVLEMFFIGKLLNVIISSI